MMSEQESQPFDPEQAPTRSVKSWLSTALDAYFGGDSERWAFAPLALEIGGQADLAHDLREIYDSLPSEAKPRWRDAVTELLAEQGHNPQHREATAVLIDLVALMPAFEGL